MAHRPEHERHHLGRELSIKPRRQGYVHRPIIAVAYVPASDSTYGVTEDGVVVTNLPVFAASSDPHVWVTTDPASLLLTMVERFRDVEAFNYQIVQTVEPDTEGPRVEKGARLTRFGFSQGRKRRLEGVRHRGMHTVWSPGDMTRNPADIIDGTTHADLLKWAADVRDWCKDNDVPIPSSLPGIAAALLRDGRFWQSARGRVPSATNERTRAYLPGVHSELRADAGSTHRHAIALDQRAAYHRAAQEVSTPDPTTMFARGYFTEPETSPLWAERGTGVYARTMAQPGVVFVHYTARHARTHEFRPPAIKPGEGRCALWTNEVALVESQGVIVNGIIAAWTSCDADAGLPLYGAWAGERISEADEYRRRWLKPTLHAVYGLLAMRIRQVNIGNMRGRGAPDTFILGAGHEFTVSRTELPVMPSPTTNVAMLGVLQAEIRARSLRMAQDLSTDGVTVLHVHADGIHVDGDTLPLIPDTWSVKPRTNLQYLDRVSWLSDQGDTLPGRDERQRINERRHRARLIRHLSDR